VGDGGGKKKGERKDDRNQLILRGGFTYDDIHEDPTQEREGKKGEGPSYRIEDSLRCTVGSGFARGKSQAE